MQAPTPDRRAARPADSAGAQRVATDRIDPWQARALHAALDRDDAAPVFADALPPLWHFIYFRATPRASELGPDGHPRPGGFLPDTGLPRRMWAGGRLEFHAPLRLGDEATRASVLQNVALKQGGSGSLAIVTLRHEVTGPAGLAIREEQDLIYRAAASPREGAQDGAQDGAKAGEKPPLKDERPAWRRDMTVGTTLLFRYSALTYNSHRIHYDLDHATRTEGYPGLVVHGPLMAQMLADLARDNAGRPIRRFAFRAVSPVFHDQPFEVCGRGFGDAAELWIRNHEGRLAMSAEATFG